MAQCFEGDSYVPPNLFIAFSSSLPTSQVVSEYYGGVKDMLAPD